MMMSSLFSNHHHHFIYRQNRKDHHHHHHHPERKKTEEDAILMFFYRTTTTIQTTFSRCNTKTNAFVIKQRDAAADLCASERRRRRHSTTVASSSKSSKSDDESKNESSSSFTESSFAGYTLYGSQGSRSPLVDWYLHEKQIPFEVKDPHDVSNPHPFGQVPALRHEDDVEVFESGAILLYLADTCGELADAKAKSNAYSWVLWANASLDPICFKEDANGRVIDTGIKNETKGMRRLDDVLSKREWLSGDEFGVADVAVAAYLLYVPQFFQGVSFKRWPNVAKFMGRCCSRESYAKAFGPRVQSYLIGELMKDVGNE